VNDSEPRCGSHGRRSEHLDPDAIDLDEDVCREHKGPKSSQNGRAEDARAHRLLTVSYAVSGREPKACHRAVRFDEPPRETADDLGIAGYS
jgi:hypothetical protein